MICKKDAQFPVRGSIPAISGVRMTSICQVAME
jgi:hypothetical protein